MERASIHPGLVTPVRVVGIPPKLLLVEVPLLTLPITMGFQWLSWVVAVGSFLGLHGLLVWAYAQDPDAVPVLREHMRQRARYAAQSVGVPFGGPAPWGWWEARAWIR
ncbi:MAG: hypothetical protein AAGN66_26160 [Acidobacteriota bacterium]